MTIVLPVFPLLWGAVSSVVLLTVYFGITTAVSGWSFAARQFSLQWSFIVALAIGFGIQVGLYNAIRERMRAMAGKGVLVATGATSTTAMISCCAHYLVNLLPVLGVTGLVTFVSQYQQELFWLGIAANLGGIAYMASRFKRVVSSSSHLSSL